jgi:hypothetical protein
MMSKDRPTSEIGSDTTTPSDKELAKQRLLERVRRKKANPKRPSWTRDELYE